MAIIRVFSPGLGENPADFSIYYAFSIAVFAPRRIHIRLTGQRTTILHLNATAPHFFNIVFNNDKE